MRRRVVITGIGLLTPLGLDRESSWQALLAGKSGIGPITKFDASNHSCRIAGELCGFDPLVAMHKKEARKTDAFTHYAVAASREALADSGYEISIANADRIGVYIGSGIGGLQLLENQHTILTERGPRRVSPFFIPGMILNMAAGQVSILCGAKGPNMSCATACATGTHAIGESTRLIRDGYADAMIAGDGNRDNPEIIARAGAAFIEYSTYVTKIIEDRRSHPRDDLATVLANGTVDGELMGPMETVGYYLITFSAGHDTTKNALASGICALAQNPGEFEKLKRNPELIPGAVEEILRWVSPVNYMKRVVAKDLDFRGQKLRKGDNLVLFYASANRDESIFEDPFTFRVDRHPNPPLAFGIGEHFCLGSHLARASQRAMLHELVSKIDSLELAGEPERIQSSFVVGLKALPLRYRVRRAA